MAPAERIQLFRWKFLPIEPGGDGEIRWKWEAFTQAGRLALESRETFETLTECMDDARCNGYGGR